MQDLYQQEMMNYYTFSLLIKYEDSVRWMDVVAISKDAAFADVVSAYGNVDLIQWTQQ